MHLDASHMVSLFENATEGIILTDQRGRIVLVNPAAEKIFGYASSELVDKTIEVLLPVRVRSKHEDMRREFYKHPQNRAMGHGRDLYAIRKDGSDFPVEVSLSHYQRDNELFVIAFIIDITFRKQIEENMVAQQRELEKVTNEMRKLNMGLEAKVEERTVILKEALIKLEQSQQELSDALDKERELSEIKSRFVSMASHEFRTPLSTVLSSASLLAKYTAGDDQQKRDKHIHRIKASVNHLNDILEDFLNLGKLDEGKVLGHYSEFDMQKLVGETIEEMKGLLKKDQEFSYSHMGPTTAYSDKKLLKNILINLITNAVKFSGENSTIVINSQADERNAKISVTDHGIGIAPADQEHLFSSFFRGKNAVNIQGTGLGLHIVKRYLDLLGGDVHLESKLNEGTKVSFSIPISQR